MHPPIHFNLYVYLYDVRVKIFVEGIYLTAIKFEGF